MADFKNGRFTFGADAAAVALRDGVASKTQFRDNVAVFVYDQGGLMADASIGGETFRFTQMDAAQKAAGHIEGQPEPIDQSMHQERLNKGDNPDVQIDTDTNPPDVDVQVK